MAVRAVRTDAPGPRRPRPGAERRRGCRVRHPAAPLVRVDGGRHRGGAEHLRPAGGADARARPLTAPGASRMTSASGLTPEVQLGALLQTKLFVPRVTREAVDRPRLTAVLGD